MTAYFGPTTMDMMGTAIKGAPNPMQPFKSPGDEHKQHTGHDDAGIQKAVGHVAHPFWGACAA